MPLPLGRIVRFLRRYGTNLYRSAASIPDRGSGDAVRSGPNRSGGAASHVILAVRDVDGRAQVSHGVTLKTPIRSREGCMMRRCFVTAMVLTLLACRAPERTPTAVDVRGTATTNVVAERSGTGIRVTNNLNVPIYFHVLQTGWLGLLVSCSASEISCASLAPGSSIAVPAERIHGYHEGMKQVTVAYWHSGKTNGHDEVVVDY